MREVVCAAQGTRQPGARRGGGVISIRTAAHGCQAGRLRTRSWKYLHKIHEVLVQSR